MTPLNKRLEEIAEAIKNGANPDKYTKELDILLGTEMEDRDRETEATWQAAYDRRSEVE
jgi:hypothetical protein